MKRAILVLVATIAAATVVAGAGANGSPYSPGLVYGWSGVGAKDSGIRFVAFGMPKSTIVAAVRARDGHVVKSKVLRGFYGVPLVSYDGTSGGLSGDGKSLVLASYGPLPGKSGKTRFAVLYTRTLTSRRLLVLPGSWSYDALSPDGSTMYLVEHISAGQDPRYRIRALDVRAGRLVPDPVVDRLGDEAIMGGQPVTRASSADGAWAYTLYARLAGKPFVHALNTERREAYCLDLPLDLDQQRQMQLKLRLGANGMLVVRDGRRAVALIDTKTLKVREAS
jgi:hypothetical protein